MSHFLIYKASAGSGKTYRLTGDYLKLLFRAPLSYRNILAVTFTHKATREMKSRIIGELARLSKGENSSYMKELVAEFSIKPEEVEGLAHHILEMILHDFGHFSVGTIDGFFQRVIHTFTREIGLPTGFTVELDYDRVLHEAITRMLAEVDENPSLWQWLTDFAENRVESGKNWNFRGDIYKLGTEIFREKFQSIDPSVLESAREKAFLTGYRDQLYAIQKSFEKELKQVGDSAATVMLEHNLEFNDFSHGSSGVAGYFEKIITGTGWEPGKRALDALDNPQAWYSNTSTRKEDIDKAYHGGLNDMLKKALQFVEKNRVEYQTAVKTLENIYALGFYSALSEKIREHALARNIFLLADAGRLLKEVIGENDTPFLYEKMGTRYHHFMIDEFQDTSRYQWENFKPLISNSLAEQNMNLIVGDVKQSIYRWRNSDWKILANEISHEFPEYQREEIPLEKNWRSHKMIIAFNNSVFSVAPNIMREHLETAEQFKKEDEKLSALTGMIEKAYSSVIQKPAHTQDEDAGYIMCKFFTEEKDSKWKERAIAELPGWMEKVQDQGFRPNEVAILVRTKREGRDIIQGVLQHLRQGKGKAGYLYNIMSNESLMIDASPVVRFVVGMLKYLSQPDDEVNAALLVNEYYNIVKAGEDMDQNEYFMDSKERLEGVMKEQLDFLRRNQYRSIYELVEIIVQQFNLGQISQEVPYLLTFKDMVLDFQARSPELFSFILWWEEEGRNNRAVQTSDGQDAFKLLTIHKAKGLEYEVIMIPFCNWELDHSGIKAPILWCHTSGRPFDRISQVPVRYQSALAGTIYAHEYFEERVSTAIDNLNLLYVAFTRARSAILCCAPVSKSDKIRHIGDLLYRSITRFNKTGERDHLIMLPDFFNPAEDLFVAGNWPGRSDESKPNEETLLRNVSSYEYGNRLHLRTNSLEYFNMIGSGRGEQVNEGNIYHSIFEGILTAGDVGPAVKKAYRNGHLKYEELKQVTKKVAGWLKDPIAKDWFTAGWEVKNEIDILLPDGTTRRPDRVMIKGKQATVIDYKFGEEEAKSHLEQVKWYQHYLLEMGYRPVEGFIWYLNLNKTVRINGK